MSETCSACGQEIRLSERVLKAVAEMEAEGAPRFVRAIAARVDATFPGVQRVMANLVADGRLVWPEYPAGGRIPGLAKVVVPKQRRK